MTDRPIRGDTHMSDFEALMWHLEKDPHLSSGFANISILDRAPDMSRLRSKLGEAARKVPQLRRRAVSPLGRLAPPEWRDDPEFDVDHHLRLVALPEPGTDEQLCELAVNFTHDPFDRTRPLWDFLVVDGLPDGRAALLQRFHHTVTDGVGGARLSEHYLDLDRRGASVARSRLGREPDEDPSEPAEPSNAGGFWASATDAVTHNVRRQVGAGKRSLGTALELASHPTRWPSTATQAARLSRSLAHEVSPTEQRRSPLWDKRSLRFGLELLRIPLADARLAAKRLDGTVNDFFVCAAAGGAGAYHRAMGVAVDELRMAMPVSTRTDRSAAGNAFGVTRQAVSVQADPRARFANVHQRLAAARNEPVVSVLESVAGVVNLLPTSVLVRTARHQVETVDFTTSNVRGAPVELYVGGSRIERNHPIGPLAGTAFNLTTLSYAGSLDIGLHVDLGAIEHPDLLRNCILAAFDELIELGG